jgi:hypothetical protein
MINTPSERAGHQAMMDKIRMELASSQEQRWADMHIKRTRADDDVYPDGNSDDSPA